MSDSPLCVFVRGRPRPQGSKRIVRGRMIESSRGHAAWRRALAMSLLAARQEAGGDWPITGAARVSMVFYLRRVTARPDIDKLARAVLDALVDAGVLADDSTVVHLEAWKWTAKDSDGEGVAVRVRR